MGRRRRCRWVGHRPAVEFFKPRGIPYRTLKHVTLTIGEFEAIRLSDLIGLHHEEAASRMRVSRQTFGRILNEAHRKVAECFVYGKALKIEGGNYVIVQRCLECYNCGFEWEIPLEYPLPTYCPECGDSSIQIIEGKGNDNLENTKDEISS
ncbi:DUF134 domain-containing protein [candidate division WOR-3 bacterium]|nr:DUF134 domain-containing protein [candidate division WOR-3 bacterium]